MEKKFIHFLIITGLLFFGYSLLLNKLVPQQSGPQDSSEQPLTKAIDVAQEPLVPDQDIVSENEPTVSVETGEYIVTFSLTGGYIKNLYSKIFNEDLLYHKIGITPDHLSLIFSLREDKGKIILTSSDQTVKKTFQIDRYIITCTVMSNQEKHKIAFYNSLDTNRLYQRYQEFFYRPQGQDQKLTRHNLTKSVTPSSIVSLAGFRDRYFCCAFIDQPLTVCVDKNKTKQAGTNVSIQTVVFSGTPLSLYIGPQLKDELEKADLQEVIYYGTFHPIATVLLKLITFLHLITKSWGISIIILALIIYAVLFPFTAKSTRSMKQLQLLQPKMKEMQEKYKDNPQKLQKEMMEFYKTHKINPLGGCLPIFFQLPVFFALYQILFRFVPLKGASFLWIKDLTLPDRAFMLPFSFSLPLIGTIEAINILPLLFVILMLFQQKTMSMTSSQEQQKQMMFMPVLFGLIFYNFPSSLNIYWLMQQILTVTYQYRISKADSAE